ncbi:hypothetical protein B0H19DRAFT_1080021 [Mycena capillaripes]|nr:hypothetical protein B0H19DRAFT_1080021 [Mycena capillaripes]
MSRPSSKALAGDSDAPTSTPKDAETHPNVEPPKRYRVMDSDESHQSPRGSAPVRPDELHTKDSSLAEVARGTIAVDGSEPERAATRGTVSVWRPIQSIAPAFLQRRCRDEEAPTYQGHTGGTRWSREETTNQRIMLEKENWELKEEIRRIHAQMSQLFDQNRQCNEELEALRFREEQERFGYQRRAFGTTADAASIADVRGRMDELDDEIFQIAAGLSDCDVRRKPTNINATARKAVGSELGSPTSRILGEELVKVLATGDARATPDILVQIALQTAMSTWSHMSVGCWVLGGHNDGANNFFAELYGEIWCSEDSKDASRWRAMTRKQLIKRASPTDLRGSLLQQISDLILLTKPPISRRKIEAQFGDRIEAAAQLVVELNMNIGANIVSEDLEAVLVDPGTAFDFNTMEDMWSEEGAGHSKTETVVCTTSLGLRKGGHNGKHAVMLRKPKVLLCSTLGQLLT